MVQIKRPVKTSPPAAKLQARLSQPLTPVHELIRLRAFEIFRARHGPHGDPVADWLRAEREICANGELGEPKPASTGGAGCTDLAR